MKVQLPRVEKIVFHIPEGYTMEEWIEEVGRTCYKSENKITATSANKFIRMLYNRGHHAMLEHCVASVRFSTDRAMTHELVRHRLAAYAQESTRYCNYGKGKFDNQITVIAQPGLEGEQLQVWNMAMAAAESSYLSMLELGVPAQIARSVLPIGIKSEIVITANLREWIHIFKMRCDTPAHPIIREMSLQVLDEFNKRLPAIYETQAKEFFK